MPAFRLKVKVDNDYREYQLDLEKELTVGRLRQIKAWFGPELGRYGSFFTAFSQLDPEAVLCAVWIARTAAGDKNVPVPNDMEDFAISDVFLGVVDEAPEPEKEAHPTPTPEATSTPASTGTPTGSAPKTSGGSPTSATSQQEKSTALRGSTS